MQWRVSDQLWERLAPLLVDPQRRFRYPGRARYRRDGLEGILYVLFTDTPWLQVPYRELGLPSGETCRRRLEEWQRRGVFERAIGVLHEQLAEAERLDWSRVIVDASLVDAKKGAARSRARSKAGPGRRFHLAVDANGAPLAVRLSGGNENERRHLLPLLDALAEQGIQPVELWADRGYASISLEQALRDRRIVPQDQPAARRHTSRSPGTPVREVWRGKRRRLKTRDPASPSPLARRTHQRLAEGETTDRHTTRPQTRELPAPSSNSG